MCHSIPIDEVFWALAPSKEEIEEINLNFDRTSFKGFPSKLGEQHYWLDTLAGFVDNAKKSLRQNKGYSLLKKNQDRKLYQKFFYLDKLYEVLQKSAGDLSNNEFARLYEFQVLQIVKWVVFWDSTKKFENFLRRLDTHC